MPVERPIESDYLVGYQKRGSIRQQQLLHRDHRQLRRQVRLMRGTSCLYIK